MPDLPGCVAAGETQEEVRELIEGAIELHLRGMREDGEPIPEPNRGCGWVRGYSAAVWLRAYDYCSFAARGVVAPRRASVYGH